MKYLVFAGFQTTYEELKPDIAIRASCVRAGFQTTYEELKLSFCNPRCFGHGKASRLPMRN